MSGGRASVQCTLCSRTFVVKDISDHIHEHLNYKPQKCNDCDFECVLRNELDQHTYENDHSGSQHFDAYKQLEVDRMSYDIQFAAKNGMEELLKKKKQAAYWLAATPNSSSTPRTTPTQPQQKRQRPLPTPAARRSHTPQLESSSNDEEEDPPQRRPVARPDAAKRRSDTRKAPVRMQQKSSDEGESEDDAFTKEMKTWKMEWEKFTECKLCRKKVRLNLKDRLSHVRTDHMDEDPKEHGYDIKLEQKVLKAFPGRVSNCMQCPAKTCRYPQPVVIQSSNGRLSHVISTHSKHLPPFRCPMQGCGYEHHDVNKAFSNHFSIAHALGDHWRRLIDPMKKSALDQHKAKLEEISRLMFTVDLPMKPSCPKRKANGEDDDEEAEAEKLRAIKAATAAPSKPSPPQAKKVKRRSKSASSSSDEEEDSDDEKKSKQKREREKIVRRRSDGSLMLVSDPDEEEEEEDEDESGNTSMEVDDKEEAKSGSGAGSTAVSKSSQEERKREQSPEVKAEEEEVKEEPVTPGARAQAGLVTQFSGRRLPPAPAQAINPFASHSAEQLNQTPTTSAQMSMAPKFSGRKLPPTQAPNLFPSHKESAEQRHQVLRGHRGGGGCGGIPPLMPEHGRGMRNGGRGMMDGGWNRGRGGGAERGRGRGRGDYQSRHQRHY